MTKLINIQSPFASVRHLQDEARNAATTHPGNQNLRLYLLKPAKTEPPALELMRLLGVNNGVARPTKHKVMQALVGPETLSWLGGSDHIDDAYHVVKRNDDNLGHVSPGKHAFDVTVKMNFV